MNEQEIIELFYKNFALPMYGNDKMYYKDDAWYWDEGCKFYSPSISEPWKVYKQAILDFISESNKKPSPPSP